MKFKIILLALFLNFFTQLYSDNLICNINNWLPINGDSRSVSMVSEFVKVNDRQYKELKTRGEVGVRETLWNISYEDKFLLVLFNIDAGFWSDRGFDKKKKSLEDFKRHFNDFGGPKYHLLTFSKMTNGVTIRILPLVCPYPINGYNLEGYDKKHWSEKYERGIIYTGEMFYSATDK